MTAGRIEHLSDSVTLHLGDCRGLLPSLGKVDAVVTDPPYGINAARTRKSQKDGWRDYDAPGWDREKPPAELIGAVVAAGRHAVIWGGNYFTDALPPSSKWLSWDKGQTDFSLADFELAWCSFDGAARRITVPRSVAMQDGKEHPTQKSLDVMRWCIEQIPPPATLILDPFMGSGTTGVACVQLGRKFIGIEIEEKYFDIACRRIADELRRPRLPLDPVPPPAKQEALEL